MVLGSGIRDPGSGKNLFRIQGSKSTGSRIRNTAKYAKEPASAAVGGGGGQGILVGELPIYLKKKISC